MHFRKQFFDKDKRHVDTSSRLVVLLSVCSELQWPLCDVLSLQAIHCQHKLTKVRNSTPFSASKNITRDCVSVRSRKAINFAGLHSVCTSNYFTKDDLF